MVKKKGFINRAGFTLLILFIVFFSIFPFVQMLSTSLKYQWDWGNPSLIPTQINLEAYKELILRMHSGMNWDSSHLVWVHHFEQTDQS